MYYTIYMTIAKSRLTSQGQISIPAKIRKKLGLAAGSVIAWEELNGEIIVRREEQYSSQDIHNAVFDSKPEIKDISTFDKGIEKLMKEKHARD